MCIRDRSGTARVAGFDVFRESMEVRRRIGYLPENPPLYPDMTVETCLLYTSSMALLSPLGPGLRICVRHGLIGDRLHFN